MRKWIFSFWFLVLGLMAIGKEDELIVKDTVDFYEEVFEALLKKKKQLSFSKKYLKNSALDPQYYFNSLKNSDYNKEQKNYLKTFIVDSGITEEKPVGILKLPIYFEFYDCYYSFYIQWTEVQSINIRNCQAAFIPCGHDNPENNCLTFPQISGSKIESLSIQKIDKWFQSTNNSFEFGIYNSEINFINQDNCYWPNEKFENSIFENIDISNSNTKELIIRKNIFSFRVDTILRNKYNDQGEVVGQDTIPNELFGEIKFTDNSISSLKINGNNFPNANAKEFKAKDVFPIMILGDFENLEIENNKFYTNLNLNLSSVSGRFVMQNNIYNSIALDQFIFSETYNNLKWNEFENFKLICLPFKGKSISVVGTFYRFDKKNVFMGNMPLDSLNASAHHSLLRVYKNLFDIFTKNGDKKSANGCFTEMKKVELALWEYEFKQDPSFQNFFRWQLNSFLSYFTDYGTNPAKAVIKSLWVILIFAIFYLFFPSDWDITNRAEFLNKWKALLSRKLKDESPKSPFAFYLSTVVFLLYTGFIHLLNALTLSLNAFTTLGFGDIPTHGAARYVTIVQGFIGWFLLTIFSVSLINQVLG